MFWTKQKEMHREKGSGTVVLLADRSTSMNSAAFQEMDRQIPAFAQAIPGLRVFAFHADMVEVTQGINNTHPSRGHSKTGGGYTNCTYLGEALERIARLKPSKTIVLSDGGIVDQKRALQAADAMTGDIDCYFCNAINTAWEDETFMHELARRGRGNVVHFVPYVSDARRELKRSVQVYIRPIITVERRAPEYHYSGEPVRQRIGLPPASEVAAKFTRGR